LCFVFPKEIGSVFPKEIGSTTLQACMLSATLGPAISLDLLDKPTTEALILWFAQRPSRRNVRASFILRHALAYGVWFGGSDSARKPRIRPV
jgi:hypothetical protein